MTSEMLTTYLPHTLITSNLGCWHHTFQLRFNHFLSEDPTIAVFSVKQWAPVPSRWRKESTRACCKLSSRPQLPRFFGIVRSRCTAGVIVGSGWQYKACHKAILHWDAEAEVLLVDWIELYDSYFAQQAKSSNRKRVGEVVRRFRKLEENTLRTETGGRWSGYGDWDIYAATEAEVALTCRGFEDSLDQRAESLSAREVKIRLKNLVKVIKEAIARRLEQKRRSVQQHIKRLAMMRDAERTRMSGYEALGQ